MRWPGAQWGNEQVPILTQYHAHAASADVNRLEQVRRRLTFQRNVQLPAARAPSSQGALPRRWYGIMAQVSHPVTQADAYCGTCVCRPVCRQAKGELMPVTGLFFRCTNYKSRGIT